jgi:SNF2 family DNA or RNA helicase
VKIINDPFTKLELQIEIRKLEDGHYSAEGFVYEGGRRDPLCRAISIEPGNPPKIQRGPLLQGLTRDIDFVWLERVYPAPAILDEATLLIWHDEWEGDQESAPEILFPTIDKQSPEIWPILRLTDRFGAFANLYFNYVGKGEIGFHEAGTPRFRDRSREKYWEEDLLETEFQSRRVGESHYYCPMDKVTSSLSFLLDVGWKIVDYRGNTLVRQSEVESVIEKHRHHLSLRGSVKFGEHVVDLKDVIGACQKREKFLTLSNGMVALIDEREFSSSLEEFALVDDKLILPKWRFALLQEADRPRPLQNILELLSDSGQKREKKYTPSPHFHGTLYPYQEQGLQWIASLHEEGLAGLLADEMGLGKTIQVLAFLSLLEEERPVLLVVPTSLLFHWQKEYAKFLPNRPLYLHAGPERGESLDGFATILTSYALLRQDHNSFCKQKYSCVIFDEAQTLKNPESQIATIACSLQAEFRLAMSGTPIENRPEDIWSLFRFLLPSLLGGKTEFNSRPIEYTRRMLTPFILRRKKEAVADQLPLKLQQIVWVEMDDEQRGLYERVLSTTKREVIQGKTNRIQILEKILRLRQICCHPALIGESRVHSAKVERLLEDLREIASEGRKALIYSQFTSMLSILRPLFEREQWTYSYLDGTTADREGAVQRFQEDPAVSFFLISLKAGGLGLNLTAADYVLLFDPWWNDAVERQAIDRAHRLGRSSPVVARRYITALSIEEKMIGIKERKNALMEDLLGEHGESSSFSTEELLMLLEDR